MDAEGNRKCFSVLLLEYFRINNRTTETCWLNRLTVFISNIILFAVLQNERKVFHWYDNSNDEQCDAIEQRRAKNGKAN